jgi:hypothetical protein
MVEGVGESGNGKGIVSEDEWLIFTSEGSNEICWDDEKSAGDGGGDSTF